MKKITIISILMTLILLGCKDPTTGPGDGDTKPKGDPGYISFENPAIGQKSHYVLFKGEGYWGQNSPMSITYYPDTLVWEIVAKEDDDEYIIKEYFKGSISSNSDLPFDGSIENKIEMKVDDDEVEFELMDDDKYNSFTLLRLSDEIELDLDIESNEFYQEGWKIYSNARALKLTGYINNAKIHRAEYDHLDVFFDHTATSVDGLGFTFAYNKSYGFVRTYAMNPWTNSAFGFDLVRSDKPPYEEEDLELHSLVGTKWQLVSVEFRNGEVKRIQEIIGNSSGMAPKDFNLYFKNEKNFEGRSGCNKIFGNYETDGSKLEITELISTEVACKFTGEYNSVLIQSFEYEATQKELTIKTKFDDIEALNFKRKSN